MDLTECGYEALKAIVAMLRRRKWGLLRRFTFILFVILETIFMQPSLRQPCPQALFYLF